MPPESCLSGLYVVCMQQCAVIHGSAIPGEECNENTETTLTMASFILVWGVKHIKCHEKWTGDLRESQSISSKMLTTRTTKKSLVNCFTLIQVSNKALLIANHGSFYFCHMPPSPPPPPPPPPSQKKKKKSIYNAFMISDGDFSPQTFEGMP